MFDNGNFRRKRKRRADANVGSSNVLPVKSEEDSTVLKLSETASVLSTPPQSLQNSPGSSESKSSPPPSIDHSPCFNNFVSNMNSMLAGNGNIIGSRQYDSPGLMGADGDRPHGQGLAGEPQMRPAPMTG
ncbi:hypothetical protein COCON_G00035980 [Conger conger]|uniref:Uncharacterized protein n=1 Tax=Conger conger TaxID=82655 RepID=A0A9Q1DZN8_CONCO|nr:hypothetical protein COCON_G00035980 [Conger conger]